MRTTIDGAGRVVIPKPIRESAGLAPGVSVNVEYRDGRVHIEPIYKNVKWIRKGSFVVAKAPAGTPALTADRVRKIIEETRNERVRENR